jgi:hypothetical protein
MFARGLGVRLEFRPRASQDRDHRAQRHAAPPFLASARLSRKASSQTVGSEYVRHTRSGGTRCSPEIFSGKDLIGRLPKIVL